jgi:hypothetical protein
MKLHISSKCLTEKKRQDLGYMSIVYTDPRAKDQFATQQSDKLTTTKNNQITW